MSLPIIYYDPTSEPCRAVHWLCLEANIPHEITYTWLTRNEHLSVEFLKVNPLHQVPAMKHGEFCLSEATAIMQYLTDINGCSHSWFGSSVEARANINKLLSWYHTNLRKLLTLDYFLPALLMPAYLGIPKPPESEVANKKAALFTMLGQLDTMVSSNLFLAGSTVSAPDILFASDLAALRIDPQYDEILARHCSITSWLQRLEEFSSYQVSHEIWSFVCSLIIAEGGKHGSNPEWVALACEQFNS